MAGNDKKKIPGLAVILDTVKKIFTLNIGTILFGVLLVYMVISMFMYLTANHFTSYQVLNGPLSRNETYTGLAIHEETVVSSSIGGYINYYAREGTKLNASGIVYGISSQPLQTSSTKLETEDLAKVRQQMSSYSYGFRSSNFNSVYSFKSELEGNILQYAGVNDTVSQNSDNTSEDGNSMDSDAGNSNTTASALTLGNQTLCRTAEDGIILYSKDGYENITEDTISQEDFDQNSYHKEDLKTREAIDAGSDVYTIITDERWSIYIPLSAKQVTQLNDRSYVRVKFLKDGLSQVGQFSIVEIGTGKYGKIDFSNGLTRYASDRFLDIELVTNTQTGLKIPISSITTKEFYLVPEAYQTKGGDDQSAGFLVKTKSGTEFVSATIYEEKDGNFYVEKSAFEKGAVLVKPDSDDTYVIKDTGNLEGVYCINEGYARFRRISIIAQNEEYCIVEKGTTYGLSQYDHIVYDASDINEEDILY